MRSRETDATVLVCWCKTLRTEYRFRLLGTWKLRMRGLLGSNASAEQVALSPCWSIHTVGMRYSLDVALVDSCGLVLKARRGMRPGRFMSAYGAAYALERPSSDEPWFEAGSLLSMYRSKGVKG